MKSLVYRTFLWGVTAVAIWPAGVSAEDLQTQELLERLERAEARLQQLEATPATSTLGRTEPVLFDDGTESDSLTEQLRAIQSENEALKAEQQVLGKKFADLSKAHDKFSADTLKGKGVVIPGAPEATMKINARVHADWWAFPQADSGAAALEGTPAVPLDPEDRIGLRRVRFTMRGDINDNMAYRFDVEVADPRDFEWRDAFLSFKNLPNNQEIVVGHQKRPYGWDHLNSSNDNIFMERPVVIDFVNGDARRLGIQVNGYTNDESWNWHYGLFNGDNVQDSDPFYVGDHMQMEVAARLANTWWYDEESDGRGWGHWGIAGAVAHPDGDHPNNTARFATRPEARTTDRWIDTKVIAGAQSYEVLALENVFNAGPFHAAAEAQHIFLQRDGGEDLHFWGAYGEVAYMLTGEHMQWNRKTGSLGSVQPFENFFLVDRMSGGTGSGWGAWQVAARYSFMDASDENVLGGEANSVTLGLVWYFNQNAKMQFNYVHGIIGNSADLNTAGTGDANYDMLGMRCLVFF
ncbi:MAG: porin [Planctomycetota bacterium]|nr:MAG: porin [Planctomycetota bacterium]